MSALYSKSLRGPIELGWVVKTKADEQPVRVEDT